MEMDIRCYFQGNFDQSKVQSATNSIIEIAKFLTTLFVVFHTLSNE